MSLKILKENEEGFGIIIENDAGFVSKDFSKKFMNESYTPGRSIDLDQPVYYYATLQKYGVENRNGRIYPENILKREVDKYWDVIKKNASFHELDHPEESVISLKGGSPYRILDMFWDKNVLIGKLEILISDGYRKSGIISCNGDLVAMYLGYGMTLGVSSRGIGSLKNVDGKNIVQEDFELICWDAVSSPSVYGSYIYKNQDQFNEYDENPPMKEYSVNSGSANKQDEFLSRLTSFLGK